MSLNENVTPVSCAVSWKLDPTTNTFTGNAIWQINIESPTNFVKLHALEIEITSLKVSQYKKPVKLNGTDYHGDGLITLKTSENLNEGRAELYFAFKGDIKGTIGIHYSGSDTTVLQTHFEVTHARRAFPCFDISTVRVPYKVTVTVSNMSDPSILSNQPIRSEKTSKSEKMVEFEETPPIPVYVLAFAVFGCDILSVNKDLELSSGAVLPITVSVSAGHKKYPIQLLLDATCKGVQECSDYLQLDFPLSKLDVVVVPKLCIGGMENHGIIFLDGTETAPAKGKKVSNDSLIELLMHEIAHMWMGNLVGFDFWVKEGLAQYFEKILADSFLGRKCSLPTNVEGSTAPVELDKKKKPEPAEVKKKPSKPSKKKAKKGAGTAEKKEEADAVDNHDVFNGEMYSKSLYWVVNAEQKLGKQEFLKRLSGLLEDHVDGFVEEKVFLDTFTTK
eukprot:TRINITY_DN11308_c0_g1_i1.p1 TRINITY_DN11308_c0_g1~~TRINITY_DN11308_c0_g1_i1.p1  ORF type:complete len:447 (+),score=91.81 TRINITY_DN11308_c0_g1_i1:41-1381(+)